MYVYINVTGNTRIFPAYVYYYWYNNCYYYYY